jgi:hypothetical protein
VRKAPSMLSMASVPRFKPDPEFPSLTASTASPRQPTRSNDTHTDGIYILIRMWTISKSPSINSHIIVYKTLSSVSSPKSARVLGIQEIPPSLLKNRRQRTSACCIVAIGEVAKVCTPRKVVELA